MGGGLCFLLEECIKNFYFPNNVLHSECYFNT